MTALPAGAEIDRIVCTSSEWDEIEDARKRVSTERMFYRLSYRFELPLWRGRARAAGRELRAALAAVGAGA